MECGGGKCWGLRRTTGKAPSELRRCDWTLTRPPPPTPTLKSHPCTVLHCTPCSSADGPSCKGGALGKGRQPNCHFLIPTHSPPFVHPTRSHDPFTGKGVKIQFLNPPSPSFFPFYGQDVKIRLGFGSSFETGLTGVRLNWTSIVGTLKGRNSDFMRTRFWFYRSNICPPDLCSMLKVVS